ncbi:hypothetical protein ACROYT_G005165 [Oculina patagonica]
MATQRYIFAQQTANKEMNDRTTEWKPDNFVQHHTHIAVADYSGINRKESQRDMVAQRWTVFFIFLVLCTFEAEFKDFGVCKKEIIKQLKDTIAALENCDCNAKSCAELYKSGKTSSGVYTIDPDGSGAFDVFCDQTTAGGGWTVLQKRLDGSVDFYRDWADYKIGFGNPNAEYWLGLDKIYRLTNSCGTNKLRVDLSDWQGDTRYAEYASFAISDGASKYKLSLGSYSGSAGDSLSYHNGQSFTTKDQDHDSSSGSNCAVLYKGAWWYNGCHYSNLNGLYHQGGQHSSYADGVNWYHWKGYYYSMKRAEMKIRPVNF